MTRYLVSVATDSWVTGQDRLLWQAKRYDEKVLCWTDGFPIGCPPHRTRWRMAASTESKCIPYAFKAYALHNAVLAGMETLMWCDASVYPTRSLTPLWEKIERDGVWLSNNGWTNNQWTADSAYPDLFPGDSPELARAINGQIPHVVATAFGVCVAHPIGKQFLDEYFRLASTTRAFCGPWGNTNCSTTVRGRNNDRPIGPCGPPNVFGHRHDQTAASVIAWRLGVQLTNPPEWFSYPVAGAPIGDKTFLVAKGF
jgi:hypothetical protein